jgi:hypothetical protein
MLRNLTFAFGGRAKFWLRVPQFGQSSDIPATSETRLGAIEGMPTVGFFDDIMPWKH